MEFTENPTFSDESGNRKIVRIISFNVRYATDTPFPGEEPWKVRCPKVCAQLRYTSARCRPVFICLQEVLRSQLDDILACLGEDWDCLGEGRDGNNRGEFSPILYLKESWSPLQYRTYWLSPTPDKPSRGWDAALNRVVTVAYFKDDTGMDTDADVVVMSTHLDHRGEEARQESAKLLVKLAHDWRSKFTIDKPLQTPVFLAGDFNSTPDGIAYQEIVRPGTGFKDLRDLLPKGERYGNDEITYTSFAGEEKQTRIDFIFALGLGDQDNFQTYAILPNVFDDGVFLSDHRAVVADISISFPAPSS
jgi:endonuclease/exonuclease/phosphatase family metal-dependent hydrolase